MKPFPYQFVTRLRLPIVLLFLLQHSVTADINTATTTTTTTPESLFQPPVRLLFPTDGVRLFVNGPEHLEHEGRASSAVVLFAEHQTLPDLLVCVEPVTTTTTTTTTQPPPNGTCLIPGSRRVALHGLDVGTWRTTLRRRGRSTAWSTVTTATFTVHHRPAVTIDAAMDVPDAAPPGGAMMRLAFSVSHPLPNMAVVACVDGTALLSRNVSTASPAQAPVELVHAVSPDAGSQFRLDLVLVWADVGLPVAPNASLAIHVDPLSTNTSSSSSSTRRVYVQPSDPFFVDPPQESVTTGVLHVDDMGSWCWDSPSSLALLPIVPSLMARAASCLTDQLLFRRSLADVARVSHYLMSSDDDKRAQALLEAALPDALRLAMMLPHDQDDLPATGYRRVDACEVLINYAVNLQLQNLEPEGSAYALYAAEVEACPRAYIAAGKAYEKEGDTDSARRMYGLALEHDGEDPLLRIHAATLSAPTLLDAAHGVSERRRIEAELDAMLAPEFQFASRLNAEAFAVGHLPTAGSMAYHVTYMGLNDRVIRSKLAQTYLKAVDGLRWVAPHVVDGGGDQYHLQAGDTAGTPARKLRVGFLSGLFMDHTQGQLMGGLMFHLNDTRFESHVFFASKGPVGASGGDRIGSTFVHVLERGTPMWSVRQTIASAKLDVLVFNDVGMDPFNYFLAFSRLAPVQCLTLNNGVTSGIPETMDYVLTSLMHQPSDGGTHYVERMALLPASHTYFYPPHNESSFTRPELKYPEKGWADGGPVVYLCVQALMKIQPEMDDVLVDTVLGGPPGSAAATAAAATTAATTTSSSDQSAGPPVQAVLALISKVHDYRMRTLLRRLGNNAQRRHGMAWDTFIRRHIIMLPWMHTELFWAALRDADVVLDSFPFGGGATSLLTLGFGTPLVTLPSNHRSGRLTLTAYELMGVTDLVASSRDDFVRLAVELGTNHTRRLEVRDRLLATKDVLFQDTSARTDWEELLDAVAKRPLVYA